jgi:hypothetical protein
MKIKMDTLKLELRDQGNDVSPLREHGDKVTHVRDGIMVDVESSSAIQKTKNESDNLKFQRENFRTECKHIGMLEGQLNTVREQCDNVKERCALVLEAQRIPANRDTIQERGALRAETEQLYNSESSVRRLLCWNRK